MFLQKCEINEESFIFISLILLQYFLISVDGSVDGFLQLYYTISHTAHAKEQ